MAKKAASHHPKPVRSFTLANHYTVLLIVIVLAFAGCSESPQLDATLSKPQLGDRYITYNFATPNVIKIKDKNPGQNFSLKKVLLRATTNMQGCKSSEQLVDYAPGMASIPVDLRPGCEYSIRMEGLGLRSEAISTKPSGGSGNSSDQKPGDTPGDTPGDKPGETAATRITYQQDIAPLMDKHCVSCHIEYGAMQAYPFSTYEQLKVRIDNVIERIELQNMPPRGPFFSDAQIKKMKDWRAGGFLLTNPTFLNAEEQKKLCTSKVFKFTAKSTNRVQGTVESEFIWYFQDGFN